MVVTIIKDLLSLGLSEYEAKTYVGLLKNSGHMTAYEIAKQSHVPSSKIYEVIERLAGRGIVQSIETEGVRKYSALDPGEFIAGNRLKIESSLARLAKNLSSLNKERSSSAIVSLNGIEVLMDKSFRMIRSARSELLISAWGEEFKRLVPFVAKADKRKVKIAVIHFGKVEKPAGQVFLHPIEDTIYNEKGGRGLVVVSDSREALIGTVYADGSADGGMSGNKGFVALAEDYIRHDIYIMKIVARYGNELARRFGDNYAMLRDVFSDRDMP